ncbi:MAG TPA: hypothetical protein VK106_03925, partial [Balneolaceae bacterium]|nr:hypothetical protein [Balneolaceae bacterium]
MGRNTAILILMLLISAGILGGWSYSQKSSAKAASQSKITSDAASVTSQAQPEPKSLRVIMGTMLASMQRFDLGLYNENYGLMANEAGNIADHAPIKKED